MIEPAAKKIIFAECDRALENGYDNVLSMTPEALAVDLAFYSAVAENMLITDLEELCREWQNERKRTKDSDVG